MFNGKTPPAEIFGALYSMKYSTKGTTFGRSPSFLCQQLVRALRQPTIVLDVACGYGRDTLHCTHEGHKVIAIDPSSVGIKLAKQVYACMRSREKVGDADFFVGTISSLRTERLVGQVGAILCNRGLHYMSDPEIDEFEYIASRILKPDGLLLASGTTADAFDPEKEQWDPRYPGRIACMKKQPEVKLHFTDRDFLNQRFSRRFNICNIFEKKSADDDPRGMLTMNCIIARRNLNR